MRCSLTGNYTAETSLVSEDGIIAKVGVVTDYCLPFSGEQRPVRGWHTMNKNFPRTLSNEKAMDPELGTLVGRRFSLLLIGPALMLS